MLILGVIVILALTLAVGYKILYTQREKAGVSGWVTYQDLDGKGKIYRNNATGISCKPDVISGGKIIEHKSGSGARGPHAGDILQVGATMLATGIKESELQYANKAYAVKATPELINKVTEIRNRMRHFLGNKVAPKGTPTSKRCSVCEFGMECPESAIMALKVSGHC